MQTVSHKLVNNTLYNAFGKVFTLGVNIVLTPYVLSHMDLERFGIWATITILTGYLGFFDFGIGNAFLKHIAEYHTKGELHHVNDVINTSILIYGVISFMVGLPVYFFRYEILSFFNIAPKMIEEAVFALVAGLIVFMMMNFFSVFLAVINGIQRMDVTNIMGSVMSLVRALGIVMVLKLGYGLKGLMVNQVAVSVISMVTLTLLVRKYFPAFSFRPYRFHRGIFQRLFEYGYKVQISRISQMVNLQLDKVLIGHFVTMGMVGFYDVAAKISSAIKLLPLMSLASVVPASSQLQTEGDDERIVSLFYRGSRYLLSVSIPIAIFTILHAPLVMATWLGAGYEQAAVILRILAVGYSLNAAAGVGLFIALGVGRPDMEMKYGLLVTVLNLLFSILLIIKWGAYGAALGSTLALTVSIIYFMVLFHRYLRRSTLEYYRLFVKPLVLSVALALLNYGMLHVLGVQIQGRVQGFMILLIQFISFFGVYTLILMRSRYFDVYDEEMLLSRLPFLKFICVGKHAVNIG